MPTPYEQRLQQIAEEEGMDWNTVRRVIAAEGGFTDPYNRSKGRQNGVQEYSLGPLQLNMRNGVGVEAQKAGFDASKDWEGAYRFGLNWAKKHGWNDWMGARKIGLASGKAGGGGGDQYALKKRHVGGAGSSAGNFTTDTVQQPATTVAGTETPTDPSLGDKGKPKTWNEKLGGGLAEFGKNMAEFQPIQLSGQAPVDFSGGQPMPSVYRPQLMPSQVQAGVGGMGGGQDMRQLLALLMQGGLG